MRTIEVTDELQEYMDGLLPKRDRVLARMEEEAHRENIPIVDAHEGMLLYLLVKIAGAKRILELGTAIGYSGIWLLRGSEGGSLTTFEVDHKRAERARANFSDAGLDKQARNVAHFNELVAKHPRLESVVIPVRDGVSIARVKD